MQNTMSKKLGSYLPTWLSVFLLSRARRRVKGVKESKIKILSSLADFLQKFFSLQKFLKCRHIKFYDICTKFLRLRGSSVFVYGHTSNWLIIFYVWVGTHQIHFANYNKFQNSATHAAKIKNLLIFAKLQTTCTCE